MKLFNFSRLLDNNTFLKFLSVFIALAIWFVISITVNPIATKSIKGIPINVDKQSSLNKELGLEPIDGLSQKISIVVKGKRYKVGSLTGSNFIASVSTAQVVKPGEYELDVTVLKKSQDSDYEIVSIIPSKVKLTFDRILEKEFTVECDSSSIKVGQGFVLQKPYSNPKVIKVRGPQQTIEKISKCIAKAKVDKTLSQTLTTDGTLEFYDKDMKKIELTTILVDTRKIEITFPIYKTKTIPLKFEYSNMPSNFDVSLLKHSISNKEITIAAPTDSINSLGELNIGFVDFRKIDINSSFTFDIILPTGYVNVKNIDKVVVSYNLVDFMSINQTITSVIPINLPNNYKVRVLTQRLTNVKIVGKADEIKSITPADIIAQIDLTDFALSPGQSNVAVKITLPNKKSCWAVGEYSAVINSVKIS